jgi:hypothetical protein
VSPSAKRILVLYYSQSGDVWRILDTFLRPIRALSGVELTVERLEPIAAYPFPWRTLTRLLSVFPQCHSGGGSGIHPLSIRSGRQFDLVILAYQVWFLAPSLPVQDFFRSESAAVLNNAAVITMCVCRNMWHSCSETMKAMLKQAGAEHIDNIIVSHQGPPYATFISVPRLLLRGKRDRFLGVFPPADVSDADLSRVERLGGVVAARLRHEQWPRQSLLTGAGAVHVNTRYIVPELVGWYLYRFGTRCVLLAERLGPLGRRLAIYAFAALLVIAILLGVPTILAVVLILYPLLSGRIARYARRLAEPSGSA